MLVAWREEGICHHSGEQRSSMARTSVPLTTPSQRRLLCETWQTTGDGARACQVAHVGRRTFY